MSSFITLWLAEFHLPGKPLQLYVSRVHRKANGVGSKGCRFALPIRLATET